MLLLLYWTGCATETTDDELVNSFMQAEAETGVPVELLLAIAKVETGVRPVQGVVEFDGKDPGFGVMGLRGEDLVKAASLAGFTEETVKKDDDANILAAAHLLAAWAKADNVDTSDLSAWAPEVARYSGITDDEAAREYVWYEVYEALYSGVQVGDWRSDPQLERPRYPQPSRAKEKTGDTSTVWTSSPNYNSRSGASVDYVIIHACEGSYSGCWSWLADSSSSVSAHYVVNSDGSEVRWLVDEDNRAWHISANYDCSYNSNQDCSRDGTSMNSISVGIEHAGYTSQTSWDAGLISRSAALACGVTDRHGVPRDSYHILGHGQMQPWNRSDPGTGWPWSDYIAAVQKECGDSGSSSSGGGSSSTTSSGSSGSSTTSSGTSTTGSFVIDSNNSANNTASYYVEVSSDWWSSTSASDYYNTGYWVGPTESVSDPASFYFYTSASQCYVVDAWWTEGSNRPPSVTWVAWDENDSEVGRATVNQQADGGQWNELGRWTFPTGWNRVMLSRWTTSGYYAIADAVRLTPC